MSIWGPIGGLLGGVGGALLATSNPLLGAFVGGSLLGGIGTGVDEGNAVSEANSTNVSLARENRAWQEAMWNKQTEYNSPVSQMTRLRDAGLNPNLAYGQIADSKMASVPTISSPSVDPVVYHPVNRVMDTLASYQQVKNMQVLNAKNNIELATAKSVAERAAADAKYAKYETEKLIDVGALKGDPLLLRSITRGGGILNDKFRSLWDFLGREENSHIKITIPSGN